MKIYEYHIKRSLLREEPDRKFTNPNDVAAMARLSIDMDREQEQVCLMILNGRNEMHSCSVLFVGSLDAAIIHPREVFRPAIIAGAASIIVAHNHPSGDPAPSQADKAITKRLAKAGELMGIKLLDHVIVTEDRFYSMKGEGDF